MQLKLSQHCVQNHVKRNSFCVNLSIGCFGHLKRERHSYITWQFKNSLQGFCYVLSDLADSGPNLIVIDIKKYTDSLCEAAKSGK